MTTTYRSRQGDTVDSVCWQVYGARPGAVEAVLRENPGLADAGAVLPIDTAVLLPELSAADVQRAADPVRLWG